MRKILLFLLILKAMAGCSQQVDNADYFRLFTGTVNEQLAKSLKAKK